MNEATPELKTDSATVESKHRPSLRVLVAEDHPTTRELLQILFEEMGHRVICVENGQKLLAELEKGKFDVIFTDNQMPVLSGINAIKKIRSDARFNDTPIVLMTSDPFKNIEKEIKDLNVTYLAKSSINSIKKLTGAMDGLNIQPKSVE